MKIKRIILNIIMYFCTGLFFFNKAYAAPLILAPIGVFIIQDFFIFIVVLIFSSFFIYIFLKRYLLQIYLISFFLLLIAYLFYYLQYGFLFFNYEYLLLGIFVFLFFYFKNKKIYLFFPIILFIFIFLYINIYFIFEYKVNSLYINSKIKFINEGVYIYYSNIGKNYYKINYYDKKTKSIYMLYLSLNKIKETNVYKYLGKDSLMYYYSLDFKDASFSNKIFNEKITNYIKNEI